MGRISTRRGGSDCIDPHSVGNVPMTPNAYELVMSLIGIVLVSLVVVVYL
jgi:hypothetical protein